MRYLPSVRPTRWAIVCCTAALLAIGSSRKAAGPAGYEKAGDLSGTLTSIGSDTLVNLMNYWAEEFKKMYPNVVVQIEAKGAATFLPSLVKGRSTLCPMSRKLKPEEEDAFEAKRGFKATRFDVALDCLAVYVNKDNAVKGLTIAQLDCIFSKTRKSGQKDISTWGQAGLTDPAWADLGISIYGRNSASSTYAYFKEHALLRGDFKDTVKQQPGLAGVVDAVAKDRQGIGYAGIGYKTWGVRAVALAETANAKLIEPTLENTINGTYPLGRTLYIYVAKKPGESLSPLVKEFLKFILSKQGQEFVVKDGYGRLPEKMIEKNIKQLD